MYLSLRNKILIGYLVLSMIIISLSIILFYEYFQVQKIEKGISRVDRIRNDVSLIYWSLIELVSRGETVISWDDSDYNSYHKHRMKVDSLLLCMKVYNDKNVQSIQVDSLRKTLEAKEAHLFHIMKIVQAESEADSILIYELPIIAERTVKMRTVTKKKKGLIGLLGGTEKVQIPLYTNELKDLNEKLIAEQDERSSQIELYTDSLWNQNKILIQRLNSFVASLDRQMRQSFSEQNNEIVKAQQDSFYLFVLVMAIAIVLIVFSFVIIRNDLRRDEIIKCQLQQAVKKNVDLLEVRKKIILTISHDVRGPLGNIHNCADLASETREKKKREIYLDDIRHSCHHILHFVNDLMDAYRINEAVDLRNDIPFYLDRFLQRISDEFSRKAVTKALYLESVHENSSFIVKGDADKLEQVLDNLLTNAIKFTPSGSIKFHSKYWKGKLQIEIKDTGIGMDAETLKRIFSPFERAAQNVNSEGFGLGLFLTKGLIKVLNGIITVESAPGKGSIFRLEIPLLETDEFVEEDKPDSGSITILPKNVLVVDDDPILLKIAEDMLGRKGVSCTICMNFQEVVAALEQSDYDMVLTDVQMPDTDGFALLRLLRNSDIGNSKTIPVAVMTARGDGNSGIYEKEGFAGCIHKPFNIHALLTFLSTIMSQTRLSQTGNFDFSCLLDNTDDYGHMLSLVILESQKELEELRTSIKPINRGTMRKTIHRMMPVWEMLGKEHLLRDFQEQLHDINSSDETICEHVIQIMEWIEKLIEESKNELKKYENSDS